MTTSIFDKNWLNIVFDKRNKEYGAFKVRQYAEKAVLIATIVAVALFVAAMAMPSLINALKGTSTEENTGDVLQDVELINIETLEATPPPPEFEPPPLRDEITFTPPEIVEEPTTEEVVTQDDFEEAEASTQTREGDTAGVDLSLLDTDEGDVTGDQGPPKIHISVERMPEFPGGDAALLKYLGENIKYPHVARENDIEGNVYVRFVVNEDGMVSNIEIQRGLSGCSECDQEVVRVLKRMPKWKPGMQGGQAVKVYFSLPVKFELAE